ncbi:MAG: amino acid adenylation domain-containing protein [Planctomycetota bacterium]
MSLSDRLAALSPEQRELLRRRLAERGRSDALDPEPAKEAAPEAPVSDARIPRRDPDAPLPLSHAQERLWFLNRLERDSAFYNIPMGLRMRGPLDADALARALREVARRHEVLRTTFAADGGVPRQEVHAELAPGFAVVERGDVPEEDRAAELAAAARDEARSPFDLERGPLLRATLVRFAPDDHGFLLSIHHTVADGWSRGVIVGELERLYAAFLAGKASPLAPLEIQYGDFAVWQRDWLSGARFDTEMRYWEERLAGVRELRLPTDRPRCADTVHEGAKLLRVLPHAQLERLKAFSREARVTPFMTLLAAYKILLQRLAGEDDVVVGVPTANRNWPATEPLVGFFVNSLVMRTDVGGDPTFRELLERVRRTAVDAFEHRNVPFERIVERLRPDRTLGRNPLFQVTFQYQDASYGRQNSLAPQHDFPGIEIERLPIDTGTALFDLSVNLGEIEEGLGVLVEYSTALWDGERVEALVRQLLALVEDGMARPDAPISRLAWLSETDRARTQAFARQSLKGAPPVDELVHERIARFAQERPDAPAVIAGNAELGYGELVARAQRLAAELARHGAGPERVVVVCVPRGPGLPLAPLATLEAGAAYLPLDPADPVQRRRATVADAGAVAVVTDAEHAADFAGLGAAVVDVAPFLTEPAAAQTAAPRAACAPDQLAYVVYTSGSTGAPKGVGVSHGALAHLVAWQAATWPIGPGDRGTSLAGLGFDAIVWELWMTLGCGGALVLPPDELRLDPPALAAWLARERIHVAFAPTPIAERLLAEPSLREASALRALLAGGDKLSSRPAEELPFAFENAYGPAENAVVSTMGPVEPASEADAPPSIGRPLPGVTVHALDANLLPVPVGAPGELYVGGRGLARGYRGRPGLTASRFVPDPFSNAPGARLYRTGDRVRFLPDGRLAFLGRTDHQVKVRGARLELGEIEAVLAQHPGVREVAVGSTGGDGARALVAFFVAAEGDGATGEVDEGEHVADWQRLYDSTYGGERSDEDAQDARLDLVGWMSSYDGRPIPRAEMAAWVDETVERIRALEPRRVLEIGSGTGLLLYRLAPGTERYVGVDFSAQAVERVRREVARAGDELAGVELHVARAEDAAGLLDETFDTIVLNSVVQYFPSVAYLDEVLAAAMERAAEGARIFLGDLRHADLDQAFHASVALAHAADDEPLPAVAVRAEETAARESELSLSPTLFHALCARYPRIRGVRVRPKRLPAKNELSRFRYDVLLELDREPHAGPVERTPYAVFGSLQKLRDHLARTRPGALVVEGVPNARVAAAVATANDLFGDLPGGSESEPAARLSERARHAAADAIDPDELWRLGDELGMDLDVRFGLGSPDGSLELHVGRTGTAPARVAGRELAEYGRAPSKKQDAHGRAAELRAYLEARLPAYMVPERFVALAELPLTNRGKVDRRRLAALDPGRQSDAARYVAPRNALEQRIAEVFGRVLSVERVGARDDFFLLGGHSLLATRVVSELEDALGVTLELRTLFSATTVEDLAAAVAERLDGGGADEALAPIERRSFDDGPAPASYGQRRLWLLERLLPGTPAYHMPARARFEGPLDAERLAAALDGLVARHESLRTALVEREGAQLDVVQIVSTTAEMPLEHVDLTSEPAGERDVRAGALAAEEIARPFDLALAPLARALLLRLGPDRHELIVTLHHAVADGWSVGIILRELAALYRAGDAAPLPELPISYRDYAAWQRDDARTNDDAGFWRTALDGAPARLALPTDRPRPSVPSFRGDRVPVTIARERTEALDALARARGATRFMVTLAAWQLVVHALSGEDDLVLVSPVAGRRRPETHGLVGFFVNTVPLRTRLDAEASFGELVDATRATCLAAFDHGDLPFEAILEAVRLDRDLEGAPFAQVAFALQNAPTGRAEIDELTLSIEPLETGTAKTDLALMLDEPDSAFGDEAGGLSGTLEFATDLFDRASAASIASAFEHAVEAVCADPSRTVGALAASLGLGTETAVEAQRERSNLSDNQLLVWTGQRFDPDAPLHTLAVAFHIETELDAAPLENALAVLVRSADAMRAVVVERDGVPRLELRDDIDPRPTRLDFSALDAGERERRMHAFASEPFDLAARTFRSALIRTEPGRTTWLFVQHQIVSDGTSLELVARTMSDLYARAAAGTLPETIELPAYLDHLAWEDAQRASGGFDEAQAHWQRLLDDRPEPPRFYGSTGVKRGLSIRRLRAEVPAETVERLERVLGDLAGRAGRTPVMRFRLFLAVLAAYLHRVSGRRRILIGMPWRNRGRDTARGTLGLFMRTMPVELTVDGNDTLEELFRRTGPAIKEALRHGEQVVRNPIDAPLYDVSLNLHPTAVSSFAGAAMRPTWLHAGFGFETLTVQVEDFGETGRLWLALDLHADVFDDELAELVQRHLQALLAGALVAPDRPVGTLALEPAAAPAPIDDTDATVDQTVLDAFDSRAAEAPEALAVLDGEREVSYAELDRASRDVAARLTTLGVGTEAVVALDIDRSAETIAAVLGVLRARGAFLVLDPAVPVERTERMLAAAGVRVILAGANRREALPDGPWKVCGPGAESDQPERGAHPTSRPHPRSSAYVAFTSGSTGEPKGVVVEHRSLAAFARATVATYGLDASDRMLQLSALAYDGSIEEIFGALTSGAALVLRDGPMLVDATRYAARCEEAGVTVLSHPTAFWQQMWRTFAAQDITPPSSLRVILVGGERLDPEALAPWREQAAAGHAPTLVNTYGPTETTVVVSHHTVSTEPEDPRRREVPIGRPLGDAELYVVDECGAPTPAGVAGELLVGGPTVSRGYLGQPAATAARFVPDPFSGRAGARLYRTGDLVRRRGDGALEYVGRIDRQVKVRGYRVELSEIERALKELDGVADAAVVDVTAPGGVGRALVGFAVSSSLGSADLRAALETRLPAYMVPPRWVVLDHELPQDARGKIDRAALLALAPTESEAAASYVAPRGEVERIVAEVWAEVLGLERVGAHDNFFELGGTSLSLVQMHPALVERLGVSLELVDLFRHPTVHTLAAHLAGDASRAERAAEQRDERAAARRAALERRRRGRATEGVS